MLGCDPQLLHSVHCRMWRNTVQVVLGMLWAHGHLRLKQACLAVPGVLSCKQNYKVIKVRWCSTTCLFLGALPNWGHHFQMQQRLPTNCTFVVKQLRQGPFSNSHDCRSLSGTFTADTATSNFPYAPCIFRSYWKLWRYYWEARGAQLLCTIRCVSRAEQ